MNTKIYVCSKSFTYKHFMAKRHTRYCGLVRGPHVKKMTVSGITNRVNYCANFVQGDQKVSVQLMITI
jgi:hypothetical protein